MSEDFKQLRKLLACKKHEQPPPGYFNTFSDKVIARIQASEMAEHSTWWEWVVARFDAKPLVVCAYSMVISGLLMMGFRLSQLFEAQSADLGSQEGWLAATPGNPLLPEGFLQQQLSQPLALESASYSSVNPVFQPETEPSAFGFPFRSWRVQTVNFVPAH